MRRPILVGLLALALAASGVSLWLVREISDTPPSGFDTKTRAFLGSRWDMSLKEVESANHLTLLPVDGSRRFYSDAGADTTGRYRSYDDRTARFLGWGATVTYTFRDDRLFAYHVFVTDSDGERLDREFRAYLKRIFGEGAGEPNDGAALKLIWHFKERIVNYWFMEDELSLRSKFTAGFGVTRNDG